MYLLQMDGPELALRCGIWFFIIVMVLTLLGGSVVWLLRLPLATRSLFISVSLLIGVFIVVTLYSIIKSSFHTVNILGVGIAALLWWTYKQGKSEIQVNRYFFPNLTLKYIGGLFLLLLFVYGWSFLPIINFHKTEYPYHFVILQQVKDYGFYTDVAEYLKFTGIENTFHVGNKIDSGYNFLSQYHYFELWLTAGISELTRLFSFPVLFFITYPIFLTLLFWGVMAFGEHFQTSRLKYLLPVFLFLFYGWTLLEKLDVYPFDSLWLFTRTNVMGLHSSCKKLVVLQVFMLMASLLFLKKEYKLGLISSLYLIIVSPITIPSIGGGYLLFITYLFISKKIRLKSYLSLFVSLLALLILYFLFYSTQKQDFSSYYSHSMALSTLNVIFSKKELLIFFHILIKNFIYICVLFAVIVGPILIFNVNKVKILRYFENGEGPLYIFLLGFLLSGLLAAALFNQSPDAIQFVEFGFFLALNTVLIVLILGIVNSGKLNIVSYCLLVFLSIVQSIPVYAINGALVFSTYTMPAEAEEKATERKSRRERDTFFNGVYNDTFLAQVANAFNKPGLSVSFARPATIRDSTGFMNNTFFITNGEYLHYLDNFRGVVQLSSEELKNATSLNHQLFYRQSIFVRYCDRLRREGKFQNYLQAKWRFIQEYHVKYVAAEEGSILPPEIEQTATKTLYDPGTHEKLYVLP